MLPNKKRRKMTDNINRLRGDNYVNTLLKLLKYTDTKINSCEVTDTGAKIVMQYYEWEEEIIIDFTTPSREGELGQSVFCFYKRFSDTISTPINWHPLLRGIFELSLEI